jgi:DNA-binding winged helix-turn-helix (wHTH) protein
MEYRWDDFSLDREGALLMRQGRQVNVSRKVLDCIAYLLLHRDRVVGYDELIRAIWGHDNVTNHQLAQMVLAARRTLGDDGQTQRLIRTLPGLGYRWVGVLGKGAATDASREPALDTADAAQQTVPGMRSSPDDTRTHVRSHAVAGSDDRPEEIMSKTVGTLAPHQQQAPDTSSRTETDVLASVPSAKAGRRLWAISGLALAVLITAAWGFQGRDALAPEKPPIATDKARLALIQEKYWRGDVEGVRDGLATLPAELADSPDARSLEIQLDIDRGRFERARQKLALQHAKSEAATDVVLQAKWLSMLSDLNAKAGMPAPDVFVPGQQAVALLESIGRKAPSSAMGEALSARGTGHLFAGKFELAVRDLVKARDLLLNDGDRRRATTARRMLAHTWFRMGNLTDALDELNRTAKDAETLQDANAVAMGRSA